MERRGGFVLCSNTRRLTGRRRVYGVQRIVHTLWGIVAYMGHKKERSTTRSRVFGIMSPKIPLRGVVGFWGHIARNSTTRSGLSTNCFMHIKK